MELLENVSLSKEGTFQPQSKEVFQIAQSLQKFYNSWISRKNLNHNT